MVKKEAKRITLWILGLVLIIGSCIWCSGFWFMNNSLMKPGCYCMRLANAGNPNFGNTPVYDIAMLGSHDAMSDQINTSSVEDDYDSESPDLGILNGLLLVKSIKVNYSKTQSASLREQLNAGVRFIDARITCKNGVFRATHSLLSGKLEDYLKQLINFLLDNPGEFVVFRIAKFNHTEKSENDLAEYMQKVKVQRNGREYNIYDMINYDTSKSFSSVTYNDVTSNGTKGGLVIVSSFRRIKGNVSGFEEYKITNPSLRPYYEYKRFYCNWYNKPTMKELLGMADQEAKDLENEDGFRCNGFTPTQNKKSIILNPFGSLIKIAKSGNVEVIKNSHFDKWLSSLPIVCFDEVVSTEGNFNQIVNEKILNYNLNLSKSAVSLKYNKISSASNLKNGMKIVIKEVDGSNGYYGNDYSSKSVGRYVGKQFVLNDNAGSMWTLKQVAGGWKIKRPDGKWLYRDLFGYLRTSSNENSAAIFRFDFNNNGKAKIFYNIYGMYMSGSSKVLDLSKKYSDEFEIYA